VTDSISKTLRPLDAGFTLGFIGGGQLARMSALQAFRFGMSVAVYVSSKSTEPVEHMTPKVVRGDLNDEDKLVEFASKCDIITLENEFLDSTILKNVENRSGKRIYPGTESFRLIEDKLIEKQTFEKAGIPVTPYAKLSQVSDLKAFGDKNGWPYVVKSAKGGYDGYGNATVKNLDEAVKAWESLGGLKGKVILGEAFVPYTMELAVMVARNKTGTVSYPCVESIQIDHICKEVIVPARIPDALQVQARELAVSAVEAIDGIGVFGIEFFLTHDNRILLNESAPRPHNSGHYSIEGCITSQFENHVRAVCGLPLGPTDLLAPSIVMINILGTQNGRANVIHGEDVLLNPHANLHVYGKSDSKIGRKMGHLTVLGSDVEETLNDARKLAKKIEL
jgi:5-(carboxyamino)imidazole ribonucleotide synthase